MRFLRLLELGEHSKSAISSELGQKKISGSLNMMMRQLFLAGQIELNIPNKPQSRFQKYRLTPAGWASLNDKITQ
jgi:ATP-dependent DNA helicase RecG